MYVFVLAFSSTGATTSPSCDASTELLAAWPFAVFALLVAPPSDATSNPIVVTNGTFFAALIVFRSLARQRVQSAPASAYISSIAAAYIWLTTVRFNFSVAVSSPVATPKSVGRILNFWILLAFDTAALFAASKPA
jgi:hypothetical protein